MNFLETINKIIELKKLEVDFFCDPKWAATYSEHRLKLRRFLYKKTKNKSVLNLENRPKLDNLFVSISHCPKLGGFVISKTQVGLDLEQYQRLSPNLISRISTQDEQARFNEETYQLIWTLKESVFKCGQGLAQTISEVKIDEVESPEVNSDYLNAAEEGHIYSGALASISNSKFKVHSLISQSDDLCISIAFKI